MRTLSVYLPALGSTISLRDYIDSRNKNPMNRTLDTEVLSRVEEQVKRLEFENHELIEQNRSLELLMRYTKDNCNRLLREKSKAGYLVGWLVCFLALVANLTLLSVVSYSTFYALLGVVIGTVSFLLGKFWVERDK